MIDFDQVIDREAYLKPNQTSTAEIFCKISQRLKASAYQFFS